MNPLERAIWRIAYRLGGSCRKWAWDDQFRRGRWSGLRERDTSVVDLISGIPGKIVDCGCGEGYLLDALGDVDYEGFDISSVAIATAKVRHPGANFYVADMATWGGTSGASVVLSEESIYYLSTRERRRFIDAALSSLLPGGVVISIVHDADKFADVLTDLETLAPATRMPLGTRCALVSAARPL